MKMEELQQNPEKRIVLADPALCKGDRVRFYNSDGSPTQPSEPSRGEITDRQENSTAVRVLWDDGSVGSFDVGIGSWYILGPEDWEQQVS